MLVTLGAVTTGLDPFGMLGPQVVVNLMLELCVGVDLPRHDEKFRYGAGLFKGLAKSSTSVRTARAWNSHANVLQKAACIFARLALRQANWIAL